MTSYAISERHNAQTVLWAIAGAVWSVGCGLRNMIAMLLLVAQMVAPHLMTLGKGLLLAAVLAGLVAVVAMLPLQLWVGAAIIFAYAVVFKPRAK